MPSQLTAFAYKDYMTFGYVYMGLRGVEEMTRQYNVNVHAPTMLIFKEHINKPADVIQVCENPLESRPLHSTSAWVNKQQNCSQLYSPSMEGSGVQGHSQPHDESEASLSANETLSPRKRREREEVIQMAQGIKVLAA